MLVIEALLELAQFILAFMYWILPRYDRVFGSGSTEWKEWEWSIFWNSCCTTSSFSEFCPLRNAHHMCASWEKRRESSWNWRALSLSV